MSTHCSTDRVLKVLGRLDDRHLVTLGAPESSSVERGARLASAHRLANKIKNRAIAIMTDELAGEDGGEMVANAVFDVASSWLKSWTTDDDPT